MPTHARLASTTRPVLLGPVSFLVLSRYSGAGHCLGLLPNLVPVYAEILNELAGAGAEWVQIDEPVLGLDLDATQRGAFGRVYQELHDAERAFRVVLTTYFTVLRDNLPTALALAVSALHLDAISDPTQVNEAIAAAPDSLALSLGVIDGRNVWRTDLEPTLRTLEAAKRLLGPDRLLVGPSCSLLHLPVDLDLEPSIDTELRSWLAFAAQRLEEISVLARALNDGREAVADELRESTEAAQSRAGSTRVHDPVVALRMASSNPSQEQRISGYDERQKQQTAQLGLPLLPTTTIGSFPQTGEIRSLRSQHKIGRVDTATYDNGMRAAIREVIAFQDDVELDVLVHGEPERNDIGRVLPGTFWGDVSLTSNGWVQSYGSRCG